MPVRARLTYARMRASLGASMIRSRSAIRPAPAAIRWAIRYIQLVKELTQEPDYEAVLKAVKACL